VLTLVTFLRLLGCGVRITVLACFQFITAGYVGRPVTICRHSGFDHAGVKLGLPNVLFGPTGPVRLRTWWISTGSTEDPTKG
jgi:hypothetical protein